MTPLPTHALVGLCGLAGSGKDTCAGILHQAAGFERWAFADPLRGEIAAAFGIDHDQLIDRSRKEIPSPALALKRCADPHFIAAMCRRGADLGAPRSARWVMQYWGTEYRRNQAPSYWISKTWQAVEGMRAAGVQRIVITDVRFDDEAAAIAAMGGALLHVHRPGVGKVAAHASEEFRPAAGTPVIHNDGSLIALVPETLRVTARALAGLN